MSKGRHRGPNRGGHAGRPRPGNPNYKPQETGCFGMIAVPALIVAALLTLGLLALTGCTSGDNQSPGPVIVHRDPHGRVDVQPTPSLATQAVCSGTRNAYLKDALGSNVTGKAIYNLSNADGVDGVVHNAVHNLFTAAGDTTSKTAKGIEQAYERVIKACESAGWSAK